MERPSKVARLASLRARLPYVSQSALAAVLKIAERESLPSGSRRDIGRSRDAVVEETTPYGPLHAKVPVPLLAAGDNFELEIQHPFAMLYYMCTKSADLSALVRSTYTQKVPTVADPWHLIIYSDEILPGNQLAYKNDRKMWGVYWSILEFGSAALADEEAWFEFCMCRRNIVKTMRGELSGLFAVILKTFFDPAGHHMARSGIMLKLADGSQVVLFISKVVVIADEAALHAMYLCKGSSGLKSCILCKNIYDKSERRGIVESDASGVSQHYTCTEVSKLVLHTPLTIEAILRRLFAAANSDMTKAAFAELETRLGWNFDEGGFMQDPYCRSLAEPTQHLVFDYMHIYFVSGVFNVHVGQMMWALHPHGITYDMLDKYLALWTWPKHVSTGTGSDACCSKRSRGSWESGVFKVTASEGLSLAPVLAHFLRQGILSSTNEDAKQHAACYILLAKVIELLRATARGGVSPSTLQKAIEAHLRTFRNLYGADCMIVKHHFALHLPMFLQKLGFLPSCFVHERKHKVAKRYGNQITNLSSNWEKSVLREVTSHHIAALTIDCGHHFGDGVALVHPAVPSSKFTQALIEQLQISGLECTFSTALCAKINKHERCWKGDVVEVSSGNFVGEVKWHLAVKTPQETIYLSCVSKWHKVSHGNGFSKWRRTDEMEVCLTSAIVRSLVWSRSGDDVTRLSPP